MQQFFDLIVTPVRKPTARGGDLGDLVIIIDGLDECASAQAQRDIVHIIAGSVRGRSTLFLWVFFSRPEPHITTAFASPLTHIEPPVSRVIDNENTRYLMDELEKIRKEHSLPALWPCERDMRTLVNLCAGLFICANSIIRFICEPDSSGPKDQLHTILALTTHSAKCISSHPLSELDALYILIVQRILSSILPTTRTVLLVTIFHQGTNAIIDANLPGLSEPQFRNACRALHSIPQLDGQVIRFYHASFMEFCATQQGPRISCVKTDCAVALWNELLEKPNKVHANDKSSGAIDISITWPGASPMLIYQFAVGVFFSLQLVNPIGHQYARRPFQV